MNQTPVSDCNKWQIVTSLHRKFNPLVNMSFINCQDYKTNFSEERNYESQFLYVD